MKQEIHNIGASFLTIIHTDTNRLITVSTNDKDLKKFANLLNEELKKLRTLQLEYENGNRELKTSITNISHDLRTPLTAIRGYLDLMDSAVLTDEQIKYVQIIDRKVNDLILLTEQLFDFSKSIDIQKESKKENVCINLVLEDTLASFYSLFKKHKITPKIEICEEKVVRLLNEDMLKRIFENIISNAIKYGEGEIRVALKKDGTIEFSNKTDSLDFVSVEKLFNRYYTVRNAKKASGIGLSIAKQLVELNHGSIFAKYKNHHLVIEIQF